ncbi:hypothetical protein ACJX0J_017510, partial [Zea mays]
AFNSLQFSTSLRRLLMGQVIYQYYNVKKLYDIYINVYLYSNFYIHFIPFSLFYNHPISPLIVFNKNRTGGQTTEQITFGANKHYLLLAAYADIVPGQRKNREIMTLRHL